MLAQQGRPKYARGAAENLTSGCHGATQSSEAVSRRLTAASEVKGGCKFVGAYVSGKGAGGDRPLLAPLARARERSYIIGQLARERQGGDFAQYRSCIHWYGSCHQHGRLRRHRASGRKDT